MRRVEVKICGVTTSADAVVAEAAGATYIGANLVPGSPRLISPEQSRVLAEAVRIPLAIVTVDMRPNEAAEAAREAGAAIIQLHGDETEEELGALRRLGEWELWKAVRVRNRDDVATAIRRYSGQVDLLLLDAWHPTARGGTGVRFPWEEAASLREEFPDSPRLGVAGGLTPENVAEAVRYLAPDLVDVSSGVESAPGIKDPDRVRSFVDRARAASHESVT
ncbi:MAG: phosphoribosylanthranilate isomerase [Gemmatimonadota bacterium]